MTSLPTLRNDPPFHHIFSSRFEFSMFFSTKSRLLRELSCKPTVDQCLVKTGTRSKEISRRRRSRSHGAVCRGRRGWTQLFCSFSGNRSRPWPPPSVSRGSSRRTSGRTGKSSRLFVFVETPAAPSTGSGTGTAVGVSCSGWREPFSFRFPTLFSKQLLFAWEGRFLKQLLYLLSSNHSSSQQSTQFVLYKLHELVLGTWKCVFTFRTIIKTIQIIVNCTV